MADDHIHPLSDPFLHPGLPPVRATVSGFSTAALTRGLLEREHSGMSILVTGCAGFIGSNVSSLLVESGHFVKGLDNIEPFASALARWRLGPVLRSDQFAYLQVDITDKERLFSVFSRNPETDPVDAVIHLAARAGVRASVEDPRSCYEINVLGTLNLLELCREFGVSRFILASTSSVYGDHQDGPVTEDALSNLPLSPYAASKSAAETLLHSYYHLHGMDAVVLRYFTVYGLAGRPDMSVFRFIRAITEGEPVTVYGDGTQRRDFTYVDDIARGTISALNLRGYQTINLGNDRPVSVNDLVRLIEDATVRSALVQYQERHEADPSLTWADIGRAHRLLSWSPEVTIEEGIRRTVAWYLENREWVRKIT